MNEDAVTRAIVEGYRRLPPGQIDKWGDLELQTDLAHVETLRRLDEEERTAGLGWGCATVGRTSSNAQPE